MRLPLRFLLPLASLALATALAGADEGPSIESLLNEFAISPVPSAVHYAASHGLRLQGVELAATAAPRAGDSALFLVELREGGRVRQWLVELASADIVPGSSEAKAPPPDTMHTSTGRELRYTHTPAAVAITFTGPFESGSAPAVAVRHGRAVVDAESLELGLVRYAEGAIGITRRMRAAGMDQAFYIGGTRPYDDATIARGRQAVAPFQLTAEDERLAFSVFFGLRAFFAAANEVPACREVLEAVVRKPSAWSVVRHAGVDANFAYGWQEVRALPPGALGLPVPAYLLPVKLSLNDQPALQALLAATSTHPPLRACAGLAALVVRHPEDPQRRATLRLLSARRAGPP